MNAPETNHHVCLPDINTFIFKRRSFFSSILYIYNQDHKAWMSRFNINLQTGGDHLRHLDVLPKSSVQKIIIEVSVVSMTRASYQVMKHYYCLDICPQHSISWSCRWKIIIRQESLSTQILTHFRRHPLTEWEKFKEPLKESNIIHRHNCH